MTEEMLERMLKLGGRSEECYQKLSSVYDMAMCLWTPNTYGLRAEDLYQINLGKNSSLEVGE